jgi:CheY-like chemotaxis protein
MDSNNLTSKTIIKKSNLISKRNIRVVKSLINVNIGKKGHFVRSLSQTELNNSKREKNLFSSNINVNNDNIRIIICDDDSISALSIRKLIIQYFENKNKNLPDIFYVPNGIECLHSAYSFLIEDNPIDVIIMDMNMPFLNGLNTCKLLKNILEMNDIKIFLQSSQDINIKDSGADGFFDKPLSMSNLEEIFIKKSFNQ